MKIVYTFLFFILFALLLLFNKILDSLMIIIYFLAASLIIGLGLKLLSKKQSVKDVGFGLFYGSLATSIAFAIFMLYLISALK